MHFTSPTASVPPRRLAYANDLYRVDLSELVASVLYLEIYATLGRRIGDFLTKEEVGDHEERPSPLAISGIVNLIETVSKTKPLAEPDTSVFCGEAIVTWRHGNKEVTLLSRGQADDPKIHHYEVQPGQASAHGIIPSASSENLIAQLDWMYT